MNPSAARTPARTAELSVRFGAMEGSSRAGQLTVWEGDTGKENVGQGVRSEKRKRGSWGSSSYIGVYWSERLGKYRACVWHEYTTLHLGCFDDEVEAAEAYNAKARELKGEKAKLNVVGPDEKAKLEEAQAKRRLEQEECERLEQEEYERAFIIIIFVWHFKLRAITSSCACACVMRVSSTKRSAQSTSDRGSRLSSRRRANRSTDPPSATTLSKCFLADTTTHMDTKAAATATAN